MERSLGRLTRRSNTVFDVCTLAGHVYELKNTDEVRLAQWLLMSYRTTKERRAGGLAADLRIIKERKAHPKRARHS